MREGLSRWREPVAAVLLAAVVVRTAVAVVGLAERGGSRAAETDYASWAGGAATGDAFTVVLLVLLVAGCTVWRPTAHARLLVLLTVALGTLLVLVSLVGVVVGLADDGRDALEVPVFVDGLLGLLLPALALAGLFRLLGTAPAAGSTSWAVAPRGAALAASASADRDGSESEEPDRDRDRTAVAIRDAQPTWQPDEAAGAAWFTAGDAATGAAASGWGTATGDGWRAAASDAAGSDAPGSDASASEGATGRRSWASPDERRGDPSR